MSFSLGIPTLIETPDFQRTVDLATKLKIDFVELNMNMPEFCPESLSPSTIRKVSKENGIDFTVHMPDDTDLASFHDCIREGHVKRFGETARWAAEAGMKTINLHLSPGIFFTLPDKRVWIYENYYDKFIANLKEAYSKVIDYAAEYGITVCTENVNNFHFPFIAKAIDDLCELDNFCLTWDIGHDAKTDFQEQKVLLRHEDRIRHMHLHDYNGRSDHQIPLTGDLDIKGMLRFAQRHKCSVLIETKTADSVTQSVKVVRKLLDSMWI